MNARAHRFAVAAAVVASCAVARADVTVDDIEKIDLKAPANAGAADRVTLTVPEIDASSAIKVSVKQVGAATKFTF